MVPSVTDRPVGLAGRLRHVDRPRQEPAVTKAPPPGPQVVQGPRRARTPEIPCNSELAATLGVGFLFGRVWCGAMPCHCECECVVKTDKDGNIIRPPCECHRVCACWCTCDCGCYCQNPGDMASYKIRRNIHKTPGKKNTECGCVCTPFCGCSCKCWLPCTCKTECSCPADFEIQYADVKPL